MRCFRAFPFELRSVFYSCIFSDWWGMLFVKTARLRPEMSHGGGIVTDGIVAWGRFWFSELDCLCDDTMWVSSARFLFLGLLSLHQFLRHTLLLIFLLLLIIPLKFVSPISLMWSHWLIGMVYSDFCYPSYLAIISPIPAAHQYFWRIVLLRWQSRRIIIS